MKQPCKDCPDRALHCHSACEKYAAFRAEVDAANARRREALDSLDAIITSKVHMRNAKKQPRKGRRYHG